MKQSQIQTLPDKLKLVIWDLDETFWHGTLSEEGVTPIPANIEIVRTLSNRGIVNSISSKNNHEEALAKLKELGVEEYFVFKKINWAPKGEQVKNTIEEMGLRQNNCIFIDDNLLNLNEVKSACPEIFVFHPNDILSSILQMKCAEGKNDTKLSRLAQYKVLEQKASVQREQNLSNVDFLRTCELRIEIDYDTSKHLDRIIELLDRTNQLNYTKNRLNTAEKRTEFLRAIKDYSTNAGIISCSDKFGDYGVVGFFMVRDQFKSNPRLEHFVFSCRTMNMGLEAYMYKKLGSPRINIKEPVAYGIHQYEMVDWITEGVIRDRESEHKSTVLLGPCHFLQLSNFIGAKNNFVQYVKDGSTVKFDCPAFLSTNRSVIEGTEFIKTGLSWTLEEYDSFHELIKTADTIILSLEDLFVDRQYVYENGLYFRYDGNKKIDANFRTLGINERVDIVYGFLKYVIANSKDGARLVLLDGFIGRSTPKHLRSVRIAFSHFINKHFNVSYKIYDPSCYGSQESGDGIHLDRSGYYRLSKDIKNGHSSNEQLIDYRHYDDRRNLRTRLNKVRQKFIQRIGRDSIWYAVFRIFDRYVRKI